MLLPSALCFDGSWPQAQTGTQFDKGDRWALLPGLAVGTLSLDAAGPLINPVKPQQHADTSTRKQTPGSARTPENSRST